MQLIFEAKGYSLLFPIMIEFQFYRLTTCSEGDTNFFFWPKK